MITGIVRLSYPVLFEAKENLSGALKFSASLLIPKTDKKAVEIIRQEIKAATEKGKSKCWSGKIPKFTHQALRDGDEELEDGRKTGAEYKGHYFINCTSDKRPGVVDSKLQAIIDPEEIYAGCYVRAEVNAYPYSRSGSNGVTWGLNNVMKVKDGERLDGRQAAEDAFKDFAEDNTEESFE